tara:strand:+ start:23 stop:553 length:531 start_codon:yes stop_codon:yes gene_type:complete
MINNPMRKNPMFPNQPPVTQNQGRAITPNPSGIATLQQYVNPRPPMPNTGIPETKKRPSAFDRLPSEIKEKIAELEEKAKKRKKKKPSNKFDEVMLNMKEGGDTQLGMIKQLLIDRPYRTAFGLAELGSEGIDMLSQLLQIPLFHKGGYAKKQRKRKPYKSSGFVRMKKSKKRKYI